MYRLARYQLVRTPEEFYLQTRRRRDPVRLPEARAVRRYTRRLEELADLLLGSRFFWQLEGGMGVAGHLGGFARLHRDVDVGVFIDDIHEFERRLERCRFRLFSRNRVHQLEYTPVDLVRATDAGEIATRHHVKRLTALKVDSLGRAVSPNGGLTRFDVHVHRRAGGVIQLTERRIPFPEDQFESDAAFTLPSGTRIPIASAPFLYFFKIRGRRPRHVFDRTRMEEAGVVTAAHTARLYHFFMERRAWVFAESIELRSTPPQLAPGVAPFVPNAAVVVR